MAVLNQKRVGRPEGSIYIGRGTIWGNPYYIGPDGTRLQVIEKFRQHLWKKVCAKEITLRQLADLHGKDLVCHCDPLPCHGHVLVKAAAWAHERVGPAPVFTVNDRSSHSNPTRKERVCG